MNARKATGATAAIAAARKATSDETARLLAPSHDRLSNLSTESADVALPHLVLVGVVADTADLVLVITEGTPLTTYPR